MLLSNPWVPGWHAQDSEALAEHRHAHTCPLLDFSLSYLLKQIHMET